MKDISQSDNRSVRQQALTDELLASGIPVDVHHQLDYKPVTADEAQLLVGHRKPGWVILYKDPSGKPFEHDCKPFFRLKLQTGEPKYLSPKGGGCRPYFSPLLPANALEPGKRLFITEGEKKTDCLNAHGFPTVGLSGVDAWLDHRSGNSDVVQEFSAVGWKKRSVYIVFDSDIVHKPEVKSSLLRLCEYLTLEEAYPRIILLPTEFDGDKNGADDFIHRYGSDAFSLLVEIARESGVWDKNAPPCKLFTWTPEPKEVHHKAVTASSVFARHFAVHPINGLHRWTGSHWELITGKPHQALKRHLHFWMDKMKWHKRGDSIISSIANELADRLTIEKEYWGGTDAIAFANGTLHGSTFEQSHSRSDYITSYLPYAYQPGAECPAWIEFLQSRLKAEDERKLLQAMFRWSICPKDRNASFIHEVVGNILGRKGTGKGTTCEVLIALCGGLPGIGLIRSGSFGDPNALRALIGKKIAVDPDATGVVSDNGVFNNIASNEPVPIKKLYRDIDTDRLGVVIWRFYNDAPAAFGAGVEGQDRRLVIFNFPDNVSKKDVHLKHKLLTEISGIFWWAWSIGDDEMNNRIRNRGNVKAIRQASIDAVLERNPVLRFLMEEFQDGASNLPRSDLFAKWKSWALNEGHEVGSQIRFGRLANKIPAVTDDRTSKSRLCHIAPMKEFDLAAFVGFEQLDDTLNASQTSMCHSHLSSPEVLRQNDSEQSVTDMTHFSLKPLEQEQEGEKDVNVHKGNGLPNNASLLSSEISGAIQTDLNLTAADIGSGYDICTDDGDDPHWAPRQHNGTKR